MTSPTPAPGSSTTGAHSSDDSVDESARHRATDTPGVGASRPSGTAPEPDAASAGATSDDVRKAAEEAERALAEAAKAAEQAVAAAHDDGHTAVTKGYEDARRATDQAYEQSPTRTDRSS